MYDKASIITELGEFIVQNNPYPLDDAENPYPMMLKPMRKPRLGSRADRRTMAMDLRDLMYRLQDPRYEVGGVFQLEYTNEGEEPDPMTGQPRTRRLWIVYGSGGNGG